MIKHLGQDAQGAYAFGGTCAYFLSAKVYSGYRAYAYCLGDNGIIKKIRVDANVAKALGRVKDFFTVPDKEQYSNTQMNNQTAGRSLGNGYICSQIGNQKIYLSNNSVDIFYPAKEARCEVSIINMETEMAFSANAPSSERGSRFGSFANSGPELPHEKIDYGIFRRAKENTSVSSYTELEVQSLSGNTVLATPLTTEADNIVIKEESNDIEFTTDASLEETTEIENVDTLYSSSQNPQEMLVPTGGVAAVTKPQAISLGIEQDTMALFNPELKDEAFEYDQTEVEELPLLSDELDSYMPEETENMVSNYLNKVRQRQRSIYDFESPVQESAVETVVPEMEIVTPIVEEVAEVPEMEFDLAAMMDIPAEVPMQIMDVASMVDVPVAETIETPVIEAVTEVPEMEFELAAMMDIPAEVPMQVMDVASMVDVPVMETIAVPVVKEIVETPEIEFDLAAMMDIPAEVPIQIMDVASMVDVPVMETIVATPVFEVVPEVPEMEFELAAMMDIPAEVPMQVMDVASMVDVPVTETEIVAPVVEEVIETPEMEFDLATMMDIPVEVNSENVVEAKISEEVMLLEAPSEVLAIAAPQIVEEPVTEIEETIEEVPEYNVYVDEPVVSAYDADIVSRKCVDPALVSAILFG